MRSKASPKCRPVLVALVAMLTLGALTSASASAALPEFHHAKEIALGYTLNGGEVKFKTNSGLSYGCASSKGEGSVTGAKTATAKLTFKGCRAGFTPCQSEGAAAEEIKTGSLPVELVYISKEKHEAGLVFNYKPPLPFTFAKWACNGTSQGIRNSIIAALTPVNTNTFSHTVTFAETNKAGIQNPTQYEDEEGKLITAWAEMQIVSTNWLQGALVNQLTLTTPEPLEVKA
jgi:hypothetical protein